MAIALTAIIACVATAIIVIIVAGLMGQERKIEYKIQTLYSVADEQFRQSMGRLANQRARRSRSTGNHPGRHR